MSEDQQGRETTTKHQRKTLVRIISYKKKWELSEGLIKPKQIKIPKINIFQLNGIYMLLFGTK